MTTLVNGSRPPGRFRRLGALTIVTAALLAGAASFVGANPAPGVPASPATAANLAPIWSSHFGSGKYLASPVVAGGFVYVGDEDGHLTKLPLATGTKTVVEPPLPPKFTPTWSTDVCFNGIYSKPVVANSKVFVSTIAGFVCAFDDNTGERVWYQKMPSGGWANGPLLVGDTLYVTGHNGDVMAYDAFTTGALRWSANVGGSNAQSPLLGGPIMLKGKIYVGTFDGRIMAITPPATGTTATVTQLRKFDGGQINDVLATDGTKIYASVNYVTSPSVGEVHVVALTPENVLKWKTNTRRDPTYAARIQAPTVVDGIVYVATKTNLLYLNSETGLIEQAPDTRLNQPTTPAVVNGVAYVGGLQASGGSSGALQAFDAKTGVALYYSHTPTVANTSPAVAPDGTVVLGGGNGAQGAGVVWAFAPAIPKQNR